MRLSVPIPRSYPPRKCKEPRFFDLVIEPLKLARFLTLLTAQAKAQGDRLNASGII